MAGEPNQRMSIRSRLASIASTTKGALINWTRPGSPLRLDDPRWFYGTGRNYTKPVNDMQMMSLTAAWRAVKIITESVGSMPLHLMQRTDDVPVKAHEHPLYDRLHGRSSTYQTSSAMIEQLVISLCLWNQAYIRRRGAGTRAQLYAISPAYVNPVMINGGYDLAWDVTENGKTERLGLDEITPIDGFKMPGALEGMSVAGMQQAALSLAIAAEEYGAKFFATGGRPSGVLTTDLILKEQQRDQIRESYAKLLHGNVDDMGDIAVLEGGMKYQSISATPDEAQNLATRKAAILDVSRIFGVAPHMLSEMDRATYANAEQNNREFLQFTLLPYLRRIETSINAFLLPDSDRRKYFARFSVEGLLRADSAGRAAFYKEGITWGYFTRNEVRRLEDKPRIEGGDDIYVPINTVPISKIMDVVAKDTPSETPQ